LPYLEKFLATILDIFLVSVLSIYLLLDGVKFTTWIKTNIPNSQKSRFFFLLNTIDTVLGGYLRGQTTLAAIIGLLIGFGMFFLHVPYAALLGVLAFFLAYIPTIGTITSGVICVALALTQGVVTALITLVYFVVMHFIESDILGPKIVGKELGIHPAISILAVIAGNELFGIIGMLVASPVAGIVQAISFAIWKEWRLTHPEEFSIKKEHQKYHKKILQNKIKTNETNKEDEGIDDLLKPAIKQ
jgi:predicted PurR-regulated permease PerM